MQELVYLSDKKELNSNDNLVDLFAGCGGSGGGLLDASKLLSRSVRGTFVNHWDRAIEIHQINHPEHRHLEEDLFLLNPADVFPVGTSCSLLWASPSCQHFSIARGAACVNEQERSHAFTIVDWVKHLNPEAVIVENVREFESFGPVIQKRHWDGPYKGELMWALRSRPVKQMPAPLVRRRRETEGAWSERVLAAGYQRYEVPDKTRKGEYFQAWLEDMGNLGYDVEYRFLKSADYGDPTIRTRIYVYCVRRDSGKAIVWPAPYAGQRDTRHDRPMDWMTARDIIQWDIKGTSVFTRPKRLANNTFRRLAIGLVKYGLREFLISSAHGSTSAKECEHRVHSPDDPLATLTQKGDRGVVRAVGEFLTPNFSEREGQEPRTHSADAPVPTVTSHGAGGVVEAEAFIVPHHAGHKKDWVKGVDQPVSTLVTSHTGEGLAEPSIVQLKGQSTSQDVNAPLTALTGCQAHYLMEPDCVLLDHQRNTGVAKTADEPLRSVTAGGQHQAIAEAFMFAIDQTGGERKNDGTYSADEPVRTMVTKANQSCIEVQLEEVSDRFLTECEAREVDVDRAKTFLGFLIEELHRRGKVEAKPWIYVYYSNGSEGKEIDAPLPTVRTKAGHALVYPVIELHGRLIKIDLLYRMLTPLELQRAMGFPDDMVWPEGCTKTEVIKAIGNSVSRGVARALGLAWYSQDENVWDKVKDIYQRP